jgi:predicted KAP-like P-loop ATPase
MSNSEQKHLFSADRPINSAKEDLLNRSSFAESLAKAIKDWIGSDSLVLALYGPWGSGKSSVKNIILESLKKSDTTCPYIVEFNPWQWAGQERLTEAFFHEIGIVLGKDTTNEESKKRAAKWRAYGTYLSIGASVTKSLKTILPFLGVHEPGLTDSVAEGMKKSAEVIKDGAEVLSTSETYSLSELKKDISDMLARFDRPILVVIDDLDRLSTSEIKLMFQLIKANADFPNMVYLLLFQRDIVEKSLNEIAPISGREFLEKIVQVGFDIPKIEFTQLQKILCDGLDRLLDDTSIIKLFDNRRWANIFIPGLSQYFKNLRDVNRFLGTLSFQISTFRNEECFEVNPIDLIALEVLRVFEPEVYHKIYESKSILTRQNYGLSGKDANDLTRVECESITNLASEGNRTQVKEIIKQLFPTIEWVLGGYTYGADFEEGWFRELRVCHSNIFDRFFYLAIPESDISHAELERILALAGDRAKLVAEFNVFSKRGLLEVVLNRLEAYKEQIDLKYAVPFITALFDIGEKLTDDAPGFFGMGSDMHASRIIFWCLKKEADAEKRANILKDALHATDGVYLPVMRIFDEDSKQKRKKDPSTYLVDENSLEELKRIGIDKIRKAAESGKLNTHPKMAPILYRWRDCTSAEEPARWVEKLIETREGVIAFLTAFLQRSKVHGMGDYTYRIRYSISLKNIEDFVPADVLRQKAEQVIIEDLSKEQQKAFSVFQKALKRKEEGEADSDWWDEDE